MRPPRLLRLPAGIYNRPGPHPGGPVFPGCLILGQLARQPSFWLPIEAGRSAKSGSFGRPEETPARRIFPGPGSEGNNRGLSRNRPRRSWLVPSTKGGTMSRRPLGRARGGRPAVTIRRSPVVLPACCRCTSLPYLPAFPHPSSALRPRPLCRGEHRSSAQHSHTSHTAPRRIRNRPGWRLTPRGLSPRRTCVRSFPSLCS